LFPIAELFPNILIKPKATTNDRANQYQLSTTRRTNAEKDMRCGRTVFEGEKVESIYD
jgi:hypothetical protein